jgi:hypothetical protein
MTGVLALLKFSADLWDSSCGGVDKAHLSYICGSVETALRALASGRSDDWQSDGDGMKDLSWHRLHAIQVAWMPPENEEDTLIVLRLATELVTHFLAEPPKERPKLYQRWLGELTEAPLASMVRLTGDS